MLSEEEIQEIKQKIISQIESTFPIEQVANARRQVEVMNPEELEKFLERNKMIISDEENNKEEGNECVFCSIASEKIKSVKIAENKKAIAVLEINPVSRGHSLIIPKEHITSSDKLPKEAFELAEKISKRIKKKFKPKDVTISSFNLFGHEVIAVLPVYTNETLASKKSQAKPEELGKLKSELEEKPKKPKVKKAKKLKKLDEKKLWLPVRIP